MRTSKVPRTEDHCPAQQRLNKTPAQRMADCTFLGPTAAEHAEKERDERAAKEREEKAEKRRTQQVLEAVNYVEKSSFWAAIDLPAADVIQDGEKRANFIKARGKLEGKITIEGNPSVVQFIANKYSNTVLEQDVVYVGGAGVNPTVEELLQNPDNTPPPTPQQPAVPLAERPQKRKRRSPSPDNSANATPPRRKPKRQAVPRDRARRVAPADRRRPVLRKRPSPAGERIRRPAEKKPSLKERLAAAERELARADREADTGDEREQGAEPFLDYSLLDEED